MKKLIIAGSISVLAAIAMCAPAAHGASWIDVVEPKNGESVFAIDLDSAAIKSNTMVVWVRNKFSDDSESLYLEQFDCQYIRIRYFEVIGHSQSGEVFDHRVDNKPRWQSIIPGSVGEALRAAVCQIRGWALSKKVRSRHEPVY